MLVSFLLGIFTVVLFYYFRWAIRQIYSYIWAYGEESIYGLMLLLSMVLLASCSKEEVPQVCFDGSCDASLEIDAVLDSNGYYHVDLDWNSEYWPRFSVGTYADSTDPYWWYNDSPVVQANFYTDTTIEVGNDVIPIVQSSRIYLSSRNGSKVLYGKRIVGPFPPEMQGDTLEIKAEIFWDAGIHYKEKEISLKFIIE